MPGWRGPEYDGEFPSLGWDVLDWIANYLRVPDGPKAGEPLEFTDEQATILVRWYGIDDRGHWLFRRGCKRAAQGWGKSPFLGAIGLAELAGPTRFDGWDAQGEPVAIPPAAPWVQVAAVSEDQTDNTFAAAYAMAQESELAGTVIDVGLTRMFLLGQTGRLEPVTASAGSRLGQRITFAVLDETHLWTKRNGGHKLAATIRRNASKMNGRTFESTNAHLVGEDSVAERSYQASTRGAAGLLYDAIQAPPIEDLHDTAAVATALRAAYGDSALPSGWIDLDRLALEIADPGTDPDDARRFYFNQLVTGSNRPVDMQHWSELARPEGWPEDGTEIGVGFDGSVSDDKTALWGCTRGGYLFKIRVWERPINASRDWLIPRLEVRDAIYDTFARWRVGRMFADPPKWWTELEEWALAFGDETVLALDTYQARRFAPACDRFATAARDGSLSHDGDRGLTDALAGAQKVPVRLSDDDDDGRSRFVIAKADARKIDEAVAAILAFEAAMSMPEAPTVALIDLASV